MTNLLIGTSLHSADVLEDDVFPCVDLLSILVPAFDATPLLVVSVESQKTLSTKMAFGI